MFVSAPEDGTRVASLAGTMSDADFWVLGLPARAPPLAAELPSDLSLRSWQSDESWNYQTPSADDP